MTTTLTTSRPGSKEREPWRRRWTRAEYYSLVRAGVLTTESHVELIDGEIVEMSPQLSPHTTGVQLVRRVLEATLPGGMHTRIQMPLSLGEASDPEPDVAVVAGAIEDYADAHPATALLVVEVSLTTLRYDRTTKASLYASAGIPEYWVEDLVHRRLEVHQEPAAIRGKPFGHGYKRVRVYGLADRVPHPLVPGTFLPVAELFPRR